jgi:hypothetical protein
MGHSLPWGSEKFPLADFKLIEIWPTGPQLVRNGSAFVRFICSPEYEVTSGVIVDLSTRETTNLIGVSRVLRGDGIENVVQVFFPKIGRYAVFLNLSDRNQQIWRIPCVTYGKLFWRFDVSGCTSTSLVTVGH